jgi:hypothetical protein
MSRNGARHHRPWSATPILHEIVGRAPAGRQSGTELLVTICARVRFLNFAALVALDYDFRRCVGLSNGKGDAWDARRFSAVMQRPQRPRTFQLEGSLTAGQLPSSLSMPPATPPLWRPRARPTSSFRLRSASDTSGACPQRSPTGHIFWRPARNRTDSTAAWKSKRREGKLPRQTHSYGNDGPWKAWKAKSRLPTLSTVLGNHANPA